MNKQQRWQRRQIANGRCLICGRVRDNHTLRCGACREKKRATDRRRYFFQTEVVSDGA